MSGDYIETTVTGDGALGYHVTCACGFDDPMVWEDRKDAQATAVLHRWRMDHRPFTPADVTEQSGGGA